MRIAKPIDRVFNAWLQQWLGGEHRGRLLAHMDMPKAGTAPAYDFSALLGPLFFVWLIQLPLPWAVVQLVAEKQLRLRSMMRMHGLANGAPPLPTYNCTCGRSRAGSCGLAQTGCCMLRGVGGVCEPAASCRRAAWQVVIHR